MLEHIFSSKARVKLLEMFLKNQEQEFFVREIARLTGEHLNSVRRELHNLQDFGLIISREDDKKKFFRVNQSFSLLEELSRLFFKPEVLDDDIQEMLLGLGDVMLIILTGFFTTIEAPVDVFIVAKDLDRKKLELLLDAYSTKHGVGLRFAVLTPEDYQYRMSIQDRFVRSIVTQPKIVVKDSQLEEVVSPS